MAAMVARAEEDEKGNAADSNDEEDLASPSTTIGDTDDETLTLAARGATWSRFSAASSILDS